MPTGLPGQHRPLRSARRRRRRRAATTSPGRSGRGRSSSTPTRAPTPTRRDKFNELVAAYGVLSNHRTRREYDQRRGAAARSRRRHAGAAERRAGCGRDRRRQAVDAPAGVDGGRRGRAGRAARRRRGVCSPGSSTRATPQRHARFRPVTAHAGRQRRHHVHRPPTARSSRPASREQHGEGSDPGPTVGCATTRRIRTHVIVDANTLGRDITLGDRRVEAVDRRAWCSWCSGARRLRNGDVRLQPLDDRDVRLAAALAHRLQAVAAVRALELVEQRGHEPGAGGAERMPERDRAAVDVHLGEVGVRFLLPGDARPTRTPR